MLSIKVRLAYLPTVFDVSVVVLGSNVGELM